MNLTYRGVSYTPSSPLVAATETDETAAFLGSRCHRKQYTVTHRITPPVELTYRGVRYSR